MPFCNKCDEYFSAFDAPTHKCPPIWWGVSPEYHGETDPKEGFRVRARSLEAAAEKWAERFDSSGADYLIAGGETVEVLLQREGEDTVYSCRVVGEQTVAYHASDVVAVSAVRKGES